jgi:hypothetical protein
VALGGRPSREDDDSYGRPLRDVEVTDIDIGRQTSKPPKDGMKDGIRRVS